MAKGSTVQLPLVPIPKSDQKYSACPLWDLGLHAHLSHVSASANANRILVSTSADAKKEGRLRLLNEKGKVLWIRDLKQPVKAQAISQNGALIAINTYDGKLSVYDISGKKLWEKDHLGRPVIFPKSNRILVFNDDDSEPKTAFATYDYSGRLIATITSKAEPIDIDASSDESFVAVAATNRSLYIISPEGKLLSRGTLNGDAVSIKTVDDPHPAVIALTVDSKNSHKQSLTYYEAKNDGRNFAVKWSTELDGRYETVRVTQDLVFLYGNGRTGQALAGHHLKDGSKSWTRSYPYPASYSSLVFTPSAKDSYLTVALDEASPAGVLHVMGVDENGSASWDAPVSASSGLYSYAATEEAVVVGAGEPGDGRVQKFRLSKSRCQK